MKLKFIILIFTVNLLTCNVANAFGAIVCEPMGNSNYICDAYAQNIDSSNVSYSWFGSPGINIQGSGNSVTVICNNTSGVIHVTVNDAIIGNTSISRGIDCSNHSGITDPPTSFPQAMNN